MDTSPTGVRGRTRAVQHCRHTYSSLVFLFDGSEHKRWRFTVGCTGSASEGLAVGTDHAVALATTTLKPRTWFYTVNHEQLCRSSLLSGRNVRWPRRMLPPSESRRVCRWDRQTDRQSEGRTPNRYIMLSTKRGQRIKPHKNSTEMKCYNVLHRIWHSIHLITPCWNIHQSLIQCTTADVLSSCHKSKRPAGPPWSVTDSNRRQTTTDTSDHY